MVNETMEPEQSEPQTNGAAPLLHWSSISSSLSSTPNRTDRDKEINSKNKKAKTQPLKIQEQDDLSTPDKLSLLADTENKPKIPDGGYGWIVVLSSLLLSLIADGVSFSFGLLYIEFLHEFKSSKSTTAWIGSLFLSVPLLTGPIMSAFVDKYGCQKMTIVGGLLSATGFIISAFVQSIEAMYITFGIISGCGLGLCYITGVVSIAYWFDKKRNLAIGLGACGTGIGTFVFAPVTQFFIEIYGWRGTTLLLAGCFLNLCVCGALMRDPDWLTKQNCKSHLVKCVEEIKNYIEEQEYHRSDFNLPTFVKQNEKVPLEVLEKLKMNKNLYDVVLENYPGLFCGKELCQIPEDSSLVNANVPVTLSLKLKKNEKKRNMTQQYSLPEKPLHEPISRARKTSLRPLDKPDSISWSKKIFWQQDCNRFMNIKLHRNSVMCRCAVINLGKLKASSCPNIYKNFVTTPNPKKEETWYKEFSRIMKESLDFSIFLELHFLLMSISTTLLCIWFIIPYFYLAEHLTRHSYTESEASLVLSIIGITNTVGMVVLGWAGDQKWMNIMKTLMTCMILCGVSCFGILYFTENFILLSVSSGLFGLFFAGSFVFTPAVLTLILPLDKFTVAWGMILLCQGVGNLIGPPLAGFLFDLTKKWDQSFIQSGIWIIVSGLLLAIILFTKNRKIL